MARLLHREEQHVELSVLLHQRPDVGRSVSLSGVAEPTDPPSVGERGDAALERPSADRVDHEISSPAVGQAQDLGGDILGHVVDPVVHAVLASRSRRPSPSAVEMTVAPAALASWMADTPTPPEPAWTSTSRPLQSSELEQAVVGRAELDRDGRGGFEGTLSGIAHVLRAGTLASSACEPCIIMATTRCPR